MSFFLAELQENSKEDLGLSPEAEKFWPVIIGGKRPGIEMSWSGPSFS
jgi:hypothetical protein